MPEDPLSREKKRTRRLMQKALEQGKLGPSQLEELRPLLQQAGVEAPEPETPLQQMGARVAEQGAKIDRFKEQVGKDMEEAASAGQDVEPERSKVMTFAEPVEVKAGVPEEDQEPLPPSMTVESSIQPPSGRPVDLLPEATAAKDTPDVEAAPATFYPGEGVEHEAHWHTDPSPDRVKSILQARLEQTDDPQERGFIEKQIQDIDSEGEDSAHYRNIADAIWNEVRSTFEEHGRPVVRTSEADWLEGDDFAQKWETATTKLAGEYAVPALAGADTALTFGAGKYIAPAVASLMEGDEEKEAAKAELEERGVVPDADERVRQAEAGNPLFSMAGYLRGFTPWGAAGMLSKPITGAMKRFAPEGAKLGRRVAAGAAAGATAAGAERAGERGVQAAGDVAQGQEAPSAAGVGADVALSALMGGGIGTVPPMMLSAGRARRRATLDKPKLGEQVQKFEEAGGRIRPLVGPSPPKGTRRMKEAGREPQPVRDPWTGRKVPDSEHIQSAMGIRSERTARRSVYAAAKKEQRFLRQVRQENQKLYSQYQEKQPLPSDFVDGLVNLAKKSKGRLFGFGEKAPEVIGRMARVRVQNPGDPMPRGGRRLDFTEIKGTPLEPLATKARQRMLKQRKPGSAPPPPIEDMEIVLEPRQLNAQEMEKKVLRPLADVLHESRAAAKKSRDLTDLDTLIRRARRNMFGDKYEAVKREQDRGFRDIKAAKKALGLDPKAPSSRQSIGRARAELDSVIDTVRQMGEKPYENRMRTLRRVFADKRNLLREFERQANLNIYENLQEAAQFQGGMSTSGTGAPHSYMTGGFGGALELRAMYPAMVGLEKAGKVPPNVAAILGNKYLHRAGDVAAVAERLGVDLGSAAGGALAEAAKFVDELRQTRDEELE